jgi:hypothetical protein
MDGNMGVARIIESFWIIPSNSLRLAQVSYSVV